MKPRLSTSFALLVLLCGFAEAQTPGQPLSQAQVQELTRMRNLPDCTNEGLKTTLRVFQAPDHVQVVALDYVNATDAACALRPDGGPSQGPDIELLPGHTAHSSFRWNTQPASPEAKCHDLNHRTMSVNRSPYGILIVSPTLLPQICSEVQYGAYFPGPFVPDWKVAERDAEALPPAPVLMSSKSTYYQMERMAVWVRLNGEPASYSPCPTLFETIRDVHGFTRIDEIANPPQNCRPRPAPKGLPNEFDVDAGDGSWGMSVGEVSAIGPLSFHNSLASRPMAKCGFFPPTLSPCISLTLRRSSETGGRSRKASALTSLLTN